MHLGSNSQSLSAGDPPLLKMIEQVFTTSPAEIASLGRALLGGGADAPSQSTASSGSGGLFAGLGELLGGQALPAERHLGTAPINVISPGQDMSMEGIGHFVAAQFPDVHNPSRGAGYSVV